MRIAAALLLCLALPALAAEPPPARKKAAAKKAAKKPPEPKPWEALMNSSRAALEASRAHPAPEAVIAAPPAPIATEAAPQPDPGPSLDFDLLETAPVETVAAPAPPAAVTDLEQSVGMRRAMLTVHQATGIATAALMGATMITGQLNYADRFNGPSTARYESSHKFLATATVTTFAAAGLLAAFAPVPLERKSEGIDRVTVHKWSMIGATAGMVAEATLGILTANHEGYADQATLAKAHLGIGYFTLLCMGVGVSALVF